ncbi:uncharacterized protein KY384_003360 [Bacidia gigantensis]|uniref:uncharacterized protein n=1 Tax=Bacidia gigantensis TaxID=2732470 RepID=UPI001D04C043|nr:uncharacterized protein KY384_003360 [Bacidia gigantensis]KAG8531728.1 hypothetical protein KY384_003360 [Bacidia gigantensis]
MSRFALIFAELYTSRGQAYVRGEVGIVERSKFEKKSGRAKQLEVIERSMGKNDVCVVQRMFVKKKRKSLGQQEFIENRGAGDSFCGDTSTKKHDKIIEVVNSESVYARKEGSMAYKAVKNESEAD